MSAITLPRSIPGQLNDVQRVLPDSGAALYFKIETGWFGSGRARANLPQG